MKDAREMTLPEETGESVHCLLRHALSQLSKQIHSKVILEVQKLTEYGTVPFLTAEHLQCYSVLRATLLVIFIYVTNL